MEVDINNLDIGLTKASKLLDLTKTKLMSCRKTEKNQIRGRLVGLVASIDLIKQFKNKGVLERSDRRKLESLENKYNNDSNKMMKMLEINEFEYDYAVFMITQTIGLLLNYVEIDEYLD